jgi:spermidine synthase
LAKPQVRVQQNRRGRTLHVDGTTASYYTPGSEATGSVWDALAAPLLWLPPRQRRSVLILGLGGGSAARMVRALAPGAKIVGVERSAEVVRAARRWFDLDTLGVEVIRSDAQSFLAKSRRSFDVVIEDVFVGQAGAEHKPSWLLEGGLCAAARRLRRGGLLITNTLDETALVARTLRPRFRSTVQIGVEGYDNRILVAGPAGLDGRGLRAAVGASPALAKALPVLSFNRIRR